MPNIPLNIICPTCSKHGKIYVEDSLVKQNVRGITAINIVKNIICEHSFLVYVDKNYNVRDAVSFDFSVELPAIKMKPQNAPQIEFDIDIIKINLLPSFIVGVLKGIFYKSKILAVSDEDHLNFHYEAFFKQILGELFNIDLTFISRVEYVRNLKQFKHYLIFQRQELINDKDKILQPKNTKIESAIVEEFFKTPDNTSSIIILKNEIFKVHMLARSVIEYAKEQNLTRINAANLSEFLKNKHGVEINSSYMQFIVEVVNSYFSEEIEKKIKLVNSFIDLL
ncbi:MAG: hypothetical protein JW891_04785 [Candidatus Lokiarchaeota archaeon]|nr:hypothetical protein [Candidatus Lokiarchaeota archaeon]